MGKDKGKPVKFGGGWEKDKKAAKDKVDKAVKRMEQERDTGGKGQQKGK